MSEKPYWEGKKYAFFQHKECEFFPCHPVADSSKFNCLFCYCPCMHWGTSAAVALPIPRTASRTAPSACCPTSRKITVILWNATAI